MPKQDTHHIARDPSRFTQDLWKRETRKTRLEIQSEMSESDRITRILLKIYEPHHEHVQEVEWAFKGIVKTLNKLSKGNYSKKLERTAIGYGLVMGISETQVLAEINRRRELHQPNAIGPPEGGASP